MLENAPLALAAIMDLKASEGLDGKVLLAPKSPTAAISVRLSRIEPAIALTRKTLTT